jgi:hypothetical protein
MCHSMGLRRSGNARDLWAVYRLDARFRGKPPTE